MRSGEVSRSGYYEWRSRGPSTSEVRRRQLAALVAWSFEDSDGIYGYRRIHAHLAQLGHPTHVVLISDLSRQGIPQGENVDVTFTINGISYELDTTRKEAEQFDADFEKYTSAARRTGGRRSSGSNTPGASTGSEQLSAIRDWARSQDLKVSDRGRISKDVQDRYRAAH